MDTMITWEGQRYVCGGEVLEWKWVCKGKKGQT